VMSRTKTLSSLSIAAIALLAAATTSFAQNQSATKANRSLAAPGSGVELASNHGSRTVFHFAGFAEPKTIADTAKKPSPPTLSPALFKSTEQFSIVKPGLSFDSNPSVYEVVPSLSSKQQFRSDDESSKEKSKSSVTFVPSRGQKIPGLAGLLNSN